VLYMQNPVLGQYYAGIGQVDDGGTASYHGVNLSVKKQMSKGINALVNYTWSHCISDQWAQNPTASNGFTIPGDRRAWRSNCLGIDIRQSFQISMVGTIPKFSNRVARLLASDWQFAPNLEIKSAQLFTLTSGVDRAVSSVLNQTPNLVAANPYNTDQTVDHWLNPAAFQAPATGTYGNLGAVNLAGPERLNFDMALLRSFPAMSRFARPLIFESANMAETSHLSRRGSSQAKSLIRAISCSLSSIVLH